MKAQSNVVALPVIIDSCEEYSNGFPLGEVFKAITRLGVSKPWKDRRRYPKSTDSHSRNGLDCTKQTFCIGKTDLGELCELLRSTEGGEGFGRGVPEPDGLPMEYAAKTKP
jgi:hypothetical protein